MSLTPREKELLDALDDAISVYQYASMTRYEREVCEEQMRKAEEVREKFIKENT